MPPTKISNSSTENLRKTCYSADINWECRAKIVLHNLSDKGLDLPPIVEMKNKMNIFI